MRVDSDSLINSISVSQDHVCCFATYTREPCELLNGLWYFPAKFVLEPLCCSKNIPRLGTIVSRRADILLKSTQVGIDVVLKRFVFFEKDLSYFVYHLVRALCGKNNRHNKFPMV